MTCERRIVEPTVQTLAFRTSTVDARHMADAQLSWFCLRFRHMTLDAVLEDPLIPAIS
jgi:hypothetical protein